MIELHKIDCADSSRGRFRTFLLAALKNFRHNVDRAQRTQKRGGRIRHLDLDINSAESQWSHEPFHHQAADHFFYRKWAFQMIEWPLEEQELSLLAAVENQNLSRCIFVFLTKQCGSATRALGAPEKMLTPELLP